MAHGGSFSCGSADNDGIRTSGNLLLHDFFQLFVVNFPIFLKWCYQRNACSFKNSHNLFSPFLLIQSQDSKKG